LHATLFSITLELLDTLVNFAESNAEIDSSAFFNSFSTSRVRQQLVTKSLKVRNESVFIKKRAPTPDIGVTNSGWFPGFHHHLHLHSHR
jgi:hypothetical protein